MLICLDQRSGTGCGTENRDNAQFCIQCGRPLRFAMQLQNVGALVGSYRIGRLIGHGGFGAVYEAQDTRTGQLVALKESFDADSIRHFQREFDVLKQLQHPNLPRYDEVFEAQGNGYLAMEFVPGQNLEEVLRANGGQPLLESQVIGYALQVCDALTYLHTQTPPIFHRDIKPANIRITPGGLIKLVDFGLVKQGMGTTQSSLKAGTPGYAPLEQYGSSANVHTDARSDIYALGVTLFQLLTGQAPLAAIERLTANPDPILSMPQLNPSLSPQVVDTVITASQLRQQDRQSDIQTFRYAMIGVRQKPAQSPPQPPRQPPVQPITQAIPNRPLAVSLVAALCLITGFSNGVGVLAGAGMWLGKKWARYLAILYLIAGIGLMLFAEFVLLTEIIWRDYSQNRSVVIGINAPLALSAWIVAMISTLGIIALALLFRSDVLDYFDPAHMPHVNQPERWVALIAGWQMLFGFWLVFPLIVGLGLLSRKQWALSMDFIVLPTVLVVAFIALGIGIALFPQPGSSFDNFYNSVFLASGLLVLSHALFVFAVSSLYLLSRREVRDIF